MNTAASARDGMCDKQCSGSSKVIIVVMIHRIANGNFINPRQGILNSQTVYNKRKAVSQFVVSPKFCLVVKI